MRLLGLAWMRIGCTPTNCRVPRREHSVRDLPHCWTTHARVTQLVVVGIDRLGRNAAEVMTTIRELGSAASCCGRCARASTRPTRPDEWWLGYSQPRELELELGRERRTAARDARRARGQSIGSPEGVGR